MLNKNAILQAVDIVIEKVEVPEWAGFVYVKSMTGAEKDDYDNSVVDISGEKVKVDMKNARAKMCARTICDKDGKLLFALSDVNALGKKNGAVLERIFDVARRLSGYGKDEIKNLAKNSKSAQAESSISG